MPKEDYKTFKEYYADPEFKARHLANMRQKVPCALCQCVVSKGNMKKHQDTKKCQKSIGAKTKMLEHLEIDNKIKTLKKI